jgi:hypothetical protein
MVTTVYHTCVACGAGAFDLEELGTELWICPPIRLAACTDRYRMGLTPTAYQNYLKARLIVDGSPAR